jgi:hypothetical protein
MNPSIQPRFCFSALFNAACVALCVATLLTLAACASADPMRVLRLGGSSRADVLANQGQPTLVWPDANGGSTLEYSQQPYGQRALMFKLDAAGLLLGFRDGLDNTERDRVMAGMTVEEVQRLLGQERTRVFFTLSGEDVWDWNVVPDQAGALRRFNVHFKDGRVVRTSYSMVYRERMFMFKD